MISLLMTMLAGAAASLFGLSYKIKQRRGLATDPLMLLFGLWFAALSAVLLAVFREPVYSPAAAWLGVLFGVFMYTAVRIFYGVVSRSQLNITWLILQFSLLIPFCLSTLYYRERLEAGGILGVGLMFLSIVFFGLARRQSGTPPAIPDRRFALMLTLSTVLSGLATAVPKVYAAVEPEGGTFTLLLYQGLTVALLAGGVLALRRGGRLPAARWFSMAPFAGFMSLTNVLSAAFLVVAIRGLPGSIVYPVRSVVNVLFVFLLSFLFFKERVRPLEAAGSLVALSGIVLVAMTLG